MDQNWHHSFNPKAFLGRVNIETLLARNDASAENRINNSTKPCFSCGGSSAPGLLLNDGAYLCKACFERTALIQYPEKYESLWREYLRARESRKQARESLNEKSGDRAAATAFQVAASLSILLLIAVVGPLALALGAALFVISILLQRAHQSKVRKWDKEYPEPKKPSLRHFHDPVAELTEGDRKTLHIFNHWPGFPPFWEYLRVVVIGRDGGRCQVAGYPSRLKLHVHHKNPRSHGGGHSPENLVSLCEFHHALEPDLGHERIWDDIETRYFTLVREHNRANRTTGGAYRVRPHLRRLELVKLDELRDLARTFGFVCPACGETHLAFTIHSERNIVEVECPHCAKFVQVRQELTEETGPRLAEILKITRNAGTWEPRWDVLSERTASLWGVWESRAVSFASIRFVAHRRGQKVIIKGKAPVSVIATGPYLKRLPDSSADTRTYQLCYAERIRPTAPYSQTLQLLSYEEPEMPDCVRRIRIKLWNDREFVIESQANKV